MKPDTDLPIIDMLPVRPELRQLLGALDRLADRSPHRIEEYADLLAAVTYECVSIGETPEELTASFDDGGMFSVALSDIDGSDVDDLPRPRRRKKHEP